VNRRNLAWLLSGALMLVIILSLVWYRLSAEPTYSGKTLSQWLELAQPDNANDTRLAPEKISEAYHAVAAIGLKAVPWLMRWIQYRPSRLRVAINHALRGRPFGIGSFQISLHEESSVGERRADCCPFGFFLLGTNGYPAIPQLCELAHNLADHSRVPNRALDALGSMGKIGVPCMLSIITNIQLSSRLRMTAAASIGQSVRLEDRPAEVVPELLKLLDSGENDLVMGAVIGLGNIAKLPEQCVPALTRTLRNTNSDPTLSVLSARSLGSFGTNAIAAVPALLSQLQTRKPEPLRAEARSALQQIDPGALENHERASP
jgi:hypothetical protein